MEQKFTLYYIAALTFIAIAFIAGITIMTCKLGSGKEGQKWEALKILMEDGKGVQILTIFVVVYAIIFLGTIGKLTEGSIAMLSGIAGYVLGSFLSVAKKSEGKTQ